MHAPSPPACPVQVRRRRRGNHARAVGVARNVAEERQRPPVPGVLQRCYAARFQRALPVYPNRGVRTTSAMVVACPRRYERR